jgi:hypothetical protein
MAAPFFDNCSTAEMHAEHLEEEILDDEEEDYSDQSEYRLADDPVLTNQFFDYDALSAYESQFDYFD